jgi:hypothetical protein
MAIFGKATGQRYESTGMPSISGVPNNTLFDLDIDGAILGADASGGIGDNIQDTQLRNAMPSDTLLPQETAQNPYGFTDFVGDELGRIEGMLEPIPMGGSEEAAADPLLGKAAGHGVGNDPAYYSGLIDYTAIPEADRAATFMNQTQVSNLENRRGNLYATQDAFSAWQSGVDASEGFYDEAERRSLRGINQNYGLSSSTLAQQYSGRNTFAEGAQMRLGLQRQSDINDTIGGFAAQRSALAMTQANQLVSLLTGMNISGGVDPNSAFNMMSQYGASGAGQAMPERYEPSIWDMIIPAAVGGVATAVAGPVAGAAAAGLTNYFNPQDQSTAGYANLSG